MTDIETHVDEVVADTDAPREDVRRSFENLLTYGVPAAEAKEIIRRKHGVNDDD